MTNKERPADKENSKYSAAPVIGITQSIYKSTAQSSLAVRNTSTIASREYQNTWD
jgi:hypothetical protein